MNPNQINTALLFHANQLYFQGVSFYRVNIRNNYIFRLRFIQNQNEHVFAVILVVFQWRSVKNMNSLVMLVISKWHSVKNMHLQVVLVVSKWRSVENMYS